MTTSKRIPQRMCIGCRSSGGKRDLVRVVRTPEGRVEVDPTGRRAGRGAYMCARLACWEEALKRDRLSPALRTSCSPQDREALAQYAQRFAPAAAGV